MLKNFSAFWKKKKNNPALKNVTYNFKSGLFYGIIGGGGGGKSTLFHSIIGEVPYFSGYI